MISSEIKMRVAQNCLRYRTGYELGLINSITYMSESCSSCVSYVKKNVQRDYLMKSGK